MRKFIGIVVGVCIILGFLVSPMSIATEGGKETRLVSEEAFLEYVSKKKEPYLAEMYDAFPFLPTVGYLYVDQWWPRGAKFLGIMVVGAALVSNENTEDIGAIVLGGSFIWEKIDLVYAVKDYNEALAQRLIEKHRVELSFDVEKQKTLVGLTYSF